MECRTKIVSVVWKFLDLPTEPCAVDERAVYNKCQGKPVKTRFWHAVQHNAAYRRFVRPFAPLKWRLALRRAIFPKAAAELAPPSAETVAFLRDALADDVHRLAEQLNRPLFWSDFAGSNQSSSPSLAEQGIVG